MPRQVKTSEEELFALCDKVQAVDGKVTAARLREAAGGGSHNRLKAAVEAWQARRNAPAKQAEGNGQGNAGRGRGRGTGRTAKASVGVDTSQRRDKTAAEKIALEDTEQIEIAMEAGRDQTALSGGETTQTETPGEPDTLSSIEQDEADVSEASDADVRPEGEDGSLSETEAAAFEQSGTEPSEATAAAPIPSKSAPSAGGANAEIARLQAHVEDLRRENGMLWDQVRHEREARIREIELLNGMIQGMRG